MLCKVLTVLPLIRSSTIIIRNSQNWFLIQVKHLYKIIGNSDSGILTCTYKSFYNRKIRCKLFDGQRLISSSTIIIRNSAFFPGQTRAQNNCQFGLWSIRNQRSWDRKVQKQIRSTSNQLEHNYNQELWFFLQVKHVRKIIVWCTYKSFYDRKCVAKCWSFNV